MNSPIQNLTVVAAVGVAFCAPLTVAQDSLSPLPERSSEVRQAIGVVRNYIAAETAEATDRIDSRSAMLEFKFRATRENGRYRLLGEEAWRHWERERSVEREIRRLAMLGEPQVEPIGENLYRVHCALHLELVEDGEAWQGVSLRSFDVALDESGAPRIRHENVLASRKGVRPGQWKRLMKNGSSSRSNLRSSPTTTRDNVIGKVEVGEALQVWDQEDERWLLVRKDDGLVGFIHRSQIDFDTPVGPQAGSESGPVAEEIQRPKHYPFATTLPGKPGYVLNPYTNTIVDVRDLRPGTLVRDPRDPVANRAFRVPLDGTPSRAVIVSED